MFPTLEVRWFLPGEIPDGLARALCECFGERIRQPSRTDVYLRQPGRDDLGIKLREGRLELKQRLTEIGELSLTPTLVGLKERWTKWSFPLTSDPSLDLEPAHWIAITKTRRLWFVDTEAATAQVELSQLRLPDGLWWSLCVEISGADTDCEDALENTMQLLTNDDALPKLERADSFGYPVFLNRSIAR